MNISKCYFQLISCVPILFSITEKTWCERIIQPCGPKLCEERCQRTADCSSHIFDEVQLTCRLVDKTSTLNLSGITGRNDHVEASVPTTSPKGDVTARHPGGEMSTMKVPHCSAADVSRLHKACKDGDQEEVKRLVNKGVVDVNCRGKGEKTAIMVIAWGENKDILKFLIEKKSDLLAHDEDGYNVLHYASSNGNTNIMLTLLDEHKIGIECKSNKGETPLLISVFACEIPVFKLLRSRGADVRAVDDSNQTILHQLCYRCCINMLKFVLSLNITDLEHRTVYGRTALMLGVGNCGVEFVKILRQQKASLTVLDNSGCHVLHRACYKGNLEMVKYLLTLDELRGFESRKDYHERTPVQLAIKKGHVAIVLFFRNNEI